MTAAQVSSRLVSMDKMVGSFVILEYYTLVVKMILQYSQQSDVSDVTLRAENHFTYQL